MLIKLWHTLKILMTGQIRAAWWYFTFVGSFDLNEDFTDEDLEVYYPDEEE